MCKENENPIDIENFLSISPTSLSDDELQKIQGGGDDPPNPYTKLKCTQCGMIFEGGFLLVRIRICDHRDSTGHKYFSPI